ncbi:MAG TPA: hypothetical protein VH419_03375 [Nocardioidaceae bacterium]
MRWVLQAGSAAGRAAVQRWPAPIAATAVVAAALTGCSGSSDAPDSSDALRTPSTSSAVPEQPGPDGATAADGSADGEVPGAAALQAGRSTPVEDPYYPETSNPEVDVLHYLLDLTYDGSGTLDGRAAVTFRVTSVTDTVRLDLSPALDVDAVTLDGEPIGFDHSGDGLVMSTAGLEPGATHAFVISYAGTPQPTEAPSRRRRTWQRSPSVPTTRTVPGPALASRCRCG